MNSEHDPKKTLRSELRDRMRRIDARELTDRSVDAAGYLFDSAEFARADVVMLFLSMPHEIDTRPLAVRAWQLGKTVTAPLISFAQRHMIPVEVRSLSDPMETDERGLSNPVNGQPVPVDEVDLVVVPGLGFDLAGHRLGRGAGFYDRFLSQPAFTGSTCGYALDDQVVDAVPAHSHDVPLDMLVTDRRVVRFSSAGSRS